MTITIEIQNWKHINFCDVLQVVINALRKCNDEGTLERNDEYHFDDYTKSGVVGTISKQL